MVVLKIKYKNKNGNITLTNVGEEGLSFTHPEAVARLKELQGEKQNHWR